MKYPLADALFHQVSAAMKSAFTLDPANVLTLITRPMWEQILQETETSPCQHPDWLASYDFIPELFGSVTRIIESPHFWSVSAAER